MENKIEFIKKPVPILGFGGGFKALDDSMQYTIYEIAIKLKELSESEKNGWSDNDVKKLSIVRHYLIDNMDMDISYKVKKKRFWFF
jgi:hypothetical protein